MSLPSGYKRLEYIQSSGTQYIDTGAPASGGFRVVTKFELSGWSSFKVLFGVYLSATDCSYLGITSAKKWEFRTTEKQNWGSPATGTAYEVDFSTIPGSVYCKINGEDQGITVGGASVDSSLSIPLLALNRNGTIQFNTAAKLWGAKIYDKTGTLRRDFIPAKNSSNVVGMWDDVSGEFYGNAGSGSFTAGPEIKNENSTLIDGTARKVTSGRCEVGATGYLVVKGRTLIDGTGYDIDLDKKRIVTITGDSVASVFGHQAGYVQIGDIKYTEPQELSVEDATQVTVCTYYNGTGTSSGVYLNGTKVANGRNTYDFILTNDCTIRFAVGTLASANIFECACYITM